MNDFVQCPHCGETKVRGFGGPHSASKCPVLMREHEARVALLKGQARALDPAPDGWEVECIPEDDWSDGFASRNGRDGWEPVAGFVNVGFWIVAKRPRR